MPSTLLLGDCLERMAEIADGSVDAVVTDPPYGLSFMGKNWDHGVPGVEFWCEMLRTIKPGGYLIAFGGTRTHHRLMVAIEDAGFQLRDTLMWMFGQGFPKGKGCLKPGYEPIILARKPGPKVLPLGIDACRIGIDDAERYIIDNRSGSDDGKRDGIYHNGVGARETGQIFKSHTLGRWPANVVLSHDPECNGHCVEGCPIAELDRQSGTLTSGKLDRSKIVAPNKTYGIAPENLTGTYEADSGGASRFFYQAKASRRDRNEGCDDPGPRRKHNELPDGDAFGNNIREGNTHPTVKPTDLMRWLIRLVSEPGMTILDPFMGSGSTGKAAAMEGVEFIGIERDAAYMTIAEKRIREAENATPLLTGT